MNYIITLILVHRASQRRLKQLTSNESGQSLIEFIATFSFSFSLLFLFLKIAMNYTNGYLLHYATYMASRKFMVLDTNETVSTVVEKSANAAEDLFRSEEEFYLETLLSPSSEIDLRFNLPTSSINKLYVGLIAEHEDKFSFTKSMGGGAEMNFISESFLLKEPPRAECRQRVCDALVSIPGISTCDVLVTGYDNGC